MNCFIKSLQLITDLSELKIRTLIEDQGIKYSSLSQEGINFNIAYTICISLGMKFYDNLKFKEKILISNPMFQKGKYIIIYSNHAVGIKDGIVSDTLCFTAQAYGYFYYPTTLTNSIRSLIPYYKFDYIGNGKNRVAFKISDDFIVKIAINDTGYSENLYDLYHTSTDYYVHSYAGNEKFIYQDLLHPDTEKKYLHQMQILSHKKGYDLVQYGLNQLEKPVFYDGKLSGKNAQSLKLSFDQNDLPLFYKWINQTEDISFAEYYWRNA